MAARTAPLEFSRTGLGTGREVPCDFQVSKTHRLGKAFSSLCMTPAGVNWAHGDDVSMGHFAHSRYGRAECDPRFISDGGKFLDVDRAVAHARKMAQAGADIIDVGGESTRPGAVPVTADEELRRVLPVIERLRDLVISVDTMKAVLRRRRWRPARAL